MATPTYTRMTRRRTAIARSEKACSGNGGSHLDAFDPRTLAAAAFPSFNFFSFGFAALAAVPPLD
jgi:hypothetical protein